MVNRKLLVKKVRQYIDTELNPSKITFTTGQRMTMKKLCQLMKSWNFRKFLSLIMNKHCQIHYRRRPNSCFVNNYFYDGLMAWETSMSIQPVFNHYKAVAYMFAYLSKSEDE